MKAEPILDEESLKDIGEYLKNNGEYRERNHLLYWLCTYTGLRIQDVLDLRVRDVRDDRGRIKDSLDITINKTTRPLKIEINADIKRLLKEYVEGKPGYSKLFASRQGDNKSITRQQAHQIFSNAGKVFGLRVSAHSLRKTFARRLYLLADKDITVVMDALGHTTPEQTRKYIGVTEAVVNSYIQKLDFMK